MPIINPEIKRYFPPYVTSHVANGVLYMDASLPRDIQTSLTRQFMVNDKTTIGKPISEVSQANTQGAREAQGLIRVIQADNRLLVMKREKTEEDFPWDSRYWNIRRGLQAREEGELDYPAYMVELQAIFTAMDTYQKIEGKPLPVEKPVACFVNPDPTQKEQWIIFEYQKQDPNSQDMGVEEVAFVRSIGSKLGDIVANDIKAIKRTDGSFVLIDTETWRTGEQFRRGLTLETI